jgi:hypothetical protein
MTEYIIKEIGPHEWLVFADRKSIALCADEIEAVKVMTEHSVRSRRPGNSVDRCPEQNPPVRLASIAAGVGHAVANKPNQAEHPPAPIPGEKQ